MAKSNTDITSTQFIQSRHLWYVAVVMAAVILGPLVILPTPFNLIPFLLVGCGLFAFAAFRQPFVGLFVYLFIFFFRPYEIFPAPVPYEKLVAILVIIVLVVHFAVKHVKIRFSRLDWAVSGMVLAAAVSVPSFTHMGDNTKSFEAFFEFFKIFLVYFFTLQITDSKSKLETIVWLFILSNLTMAATVTTNYHMGNFRYSMGIARARGYSDDGLFSHPNSVANTVVLGLPFLLYLFNHYRNLLIKLFLVAGMGLSAWTVIITGSRGGMLALFAFIVIAGWRSRYRIVSLAGAFIVILLVVVVMPDQYQDRLFSLANVFGEDKTGAAESARGRLEGLEAGIRMALQRPLTGVGIGAFARAHYYMDGVESDAHNLLGQILGELGLIGLVAFIWFILTKYRFVTGILDYYRRRNLRSDVMLVVTNSVFVATMLMFVQGISGHNLFRYNWYIFACFISIITFIHKRGFAPAETVDSDDPDTDESEPDNTPLPAERP